MSMSSWHWDGKAECPKCRGRGVVSVPDAELPPYVLDATRTCSCVLERDLLHHIERTWSGLSEIVPITESKLSSLARKNAWITASVNTLKSHLAKIARDAGVGFHSKVITDLDLMTAWLYSANEIYDADVSVKRKQNVEEAPYTRITDITEGWDLLVIRLGVKAARNQAAPEVLMEALLHREQLGKPTWIVDSDSIPLGPGHIDYHTQIMDFIAGWDRIHLDSKIVDLTPKARSAPAFTAPPPRPYIEELNPEVTDEFAEIGLELFGSRKKRGTRK